MRERDDQGVRPEAILAVLLIISILLIIFSGAFQDRSGKEWGPRFVVSVQRMFGQTTEHIKNGFGSLRRLREMRSQYESVLERLGDYQGLEREVVELRRENENLKRQLGYSASLEYDHIPARVIAGDPSNLFASVTIDKGTRDGVRIGMVVTAFQDGFFGLLGKVETVGTSSSQVRPLVDPDHYVAARLDKTRYEGLVEGRGNDEGELLMKYVRKTAQDVVCVNDLIVTSGMNSLYPPGLFIGRIREIHSREYSATLELILTPIIDVKKTEYVFLLEEK